jgi:hypothetical protein
MFKIGDKVIIKKNVSERDISYYGIFDSYFVEIKKMKYVTIGTVYSDFDNPIITLEELPQYWKMSWFKLYICQLEFNFETKIE